MKDRPLLQGYINNLRRYLALHLKGSTGVVFDVYPSDAEGALIIFKIGSGQLNQDTYHPSSPTVNDALGKIRQNAFGGNLSGFNFRGTNTVIEGNRVILIKGEDGSDSWDESAAKHDVMRVTANSSGGRA
ncbi:MAG: hypothetical protein V4607_15105 [Pseudomonadota bacterium]